MNNGKVLKEAEFAVAVNGMSPRPNDSPDELMRVRASFRLIRTLLIGSMTVVLAAGMHLAAGGALPHPMIMIGLTAVTMVPVAALSSRWLSLPRLLFVLCLGQIWLHWSFTALGSHHRLENIADSFRHTGNHVETLAVGSTGMAEQFLIMSSSMLFAHVLATLATVVLLSRAEALAKTIRVRPLHGRAYA